MSAVHGSRINRGIEIKNSFLSDDDDSEGHYSRCESESESGRTRPYRFNFIFEEDTTKKLKEKERRAIGWKKRKECAIDWKIKLTQLEKAKSSETTDELKSLRAHQDSIIKGIMRDFPELEGFDKCELTLIEESTTMTVSEEEFRKIAKVIWEGLQVFGPENLALGIMRTRQYLKEQYNGNWICTLYPQDFLDKQHEGKHPWPYSTHQGLKLLAMSLKCQSPERIWSARLAQTVV